MPARTGAARSSQSHSPPGGIPPGRARLPRALPTGIGSVADRARQSIDIHRQGITMTQQLRRLLPAAFLIAAIAAPAAHLTAATAQPRIAASTLHSFAATTAVGDRVTVTDVDLPATSETLALDVERFEVFAPDAEIVVHGASGVTTLPAPRNAYFRGTVAGEDGSRVFLEVLESGETRGIITRAGDAAV